MSNINFYFLIIFIYCVICLCACDQDISIQRTSYIDNIRSELQNQDWSTDELPCLEKTLNLLDNVKNFTLWAVWVWDSIPIKPTGQLYGSQQLLGNFDQCLNLPWFENNPELRTQYCIAEIYIKNTTDQIAGLKTIDPYGKADSYIHMPYNTTPNIDLIKWGVCLPQICQSHSIKRFLMVLLLQSHYATIAPDARIEIPEGSCQIATKNEHKSLGYNLFFIVLITLCIIAIISTATLRINKNQDDGNQLFQIMQCFSLKENIDKLVKENPEELSFMNGIRVLNAGVIIVFHHLFFVSGVSLRNGFEIEMLITDSIYAFLTRHGDIGVDTFFMMSGLLLTTSLMPKKGKEPTNPLKLIVKRYFRSAPSLAMMIAFTCTVFWHTGSGPFWPSFAGLEVEKCRKGWLTSLLMINNYVDPENVCGWGTYWSIPCDYQLYIFGIGLFYFIKKRSVTSNIIAGTFLITTILLPGIITFVCRYPPVSFFIIKTFSIYRDTEIYAKMYVTSHNRIGSFSVGMLLGYVLSVYKPKEYKNYINTKWSVIGAIIGLGLMMTAFVTGSWSFFFEYTRLWASVYAAIDRLLWTIGLALLMTCCTYGSVPLVNEFLGWSAFRPLSWLTYGVFLVHSIVIMQYSFSARQPYDFSVAHTTLGVFSVFVVSFILAYVLYLLVEAPANNLCNLLLSPRRCSSFSKQNVNGLKTINLKTAVNMKTHKNNDTIDVQNNIENNADYSQYTDITGSGRTNYCTNGLDGVNIIEADYNINNDNNIAKIQNISDDLDYDILNCSQDGKDSEGHDCKTFVNKKIN